MIETELKRSRAKIVRQRRSLLNSLSEQADLIRRALDEGIKPKRVSSLTGLHVSRISQIRAEGYAER